MTDLLSRSTGSASANGGGSGRRAARAVLESCLGITGELLLGSTCSGCGRPDVGLCADCRAVVAARPAKLVGPEPRPDRFPVTAASSAYDPILRQLISAHKDRQAWLLSGFLGDRLALAVQHLLAEADPDGSTSIHAAGGRLVLVPVPSTAAAVRRRGRDATAVLARRAASRLDLECGVSPCLRPIRPLAEQSGLNRAERQHNLAGALAVRARRAAAIEESGALVVLVDDLTTTGATLGEAARAVRSAGLPLLGAAVVAATERRAPGPRG